jgi:hypothetical protein
MQIGHVTALLVASLVAQNVPGQTVALGAHTLLGQEDGSAVSPAVTAPINTQVNGSVFIAFNAGYASNNIPPTDNKNNLWNALNQPVVYNGYGGAFDVKAYISTTHFGGNGHTVSIIKNGTTSGELTLPFIEVRNAKLVDVAQNYPSGATITSGTVNTNGPATLIALWWGDAAGLVHTAVPGNGFNIVDSFLNLPPGSAVQCAVASRQVTATGAYNMTWTHTPTQGAILWLFAFETNDRVFANSFE